MITKTNFNISLLDNVPDKPGIYLWKDKFDNVIYVGKANNLKNRMLQYFKGTINSYKTSSMVKNIYNFEFIVCKNEVDALLLEKNYIKKIRPKYNILLMDDRSYPYLKITKKENGIGFTKIYKNEKNNDNTIIIGPFVPSFGAKNLAKILESIACTENGLFIKRKDIEFWNKKFEMIKTILKNMKNFKNELIIKENDYCSKFMFEESKKIKKVLDALNYFENRQILTINNQNDFDAFVFKKIDNQFYVQGIFYRSGLQIGQIFDYGQSEFGLEDAINQFFIQFYNKHLQPKYIILDETIEKNNIFIKNIKFIFPKKGELKQIIEHLNNSLNINIDSLKNTKEQTINILMDIADDLKLNKLLNFLIVDISHSGQENKIGAVNFYANGIEHKPLHRYFKIESKNIDDFELMRQTINKIFESNMLKSIEINAIFVDGGKPQIKATKVVLTKYKINIPVIGLVKNDKHMTSHIIFNDNEIYLSKQSSLDYLRRIQENVDARAKSILNKSNRKDLFTNSFDEIQGINEEKQKLLLSYFKTFENIKNASLEELEKILKKQDAKNIYEYFLFRK